MLKKNCISILCLVILLIGLAGFQVLAQGQQKGGRGGGIAQLLEQVNLTAEQKAKIDPLLEEMRTKTRALRQDTALSDEDRREKNRSISQEYNKKIDEILTEEQRQKLAALRKEQAEKAKGQKP